MLIQLPDGNHVDPTTVRMVTAYDVHPDDAKNGPMVMIRTGNTGALQIPADSFDQARRLRDQIAMQVNEATVVEKFPTAAELASVLFPFAAVVESLGSGPLGSSDTAVVTMQSLRAAHALWVKCGDNK